MPLFTPSRTKWRKWYTSIELMHSDERTSALLATASANGNGIGSVNAQSLTITSPGTAFALVLPHDISPIVSVISYWTDRNLTNSGSTGNIAIWTSPQLIRVTTNSATRTIADGTQIQTVFTANYGGSGLSRAYIVQQELNFGTVSGYPDGNDPLGIKMLRFQRRGNDPSDTSNDSINCTGIYVYEN
jgi:hypothetical protein